MKRLSIFSALLLLLGLSACHKDAVTPEPTSLTLNQATVTLKVGETSQLIATVEPKDQTYTVTYTSDKPAVATVDAKGLITAVAEGTATVTASVGKLTQKCVVTVSNSAPQVKLELKTPTLTIKKGQTAQIEYTVTPEDTPITFTSDKTEVATVDDKGLVTAIATGQATIAVAAAGQQASVAVTVTDGEKQSNELPLLQFEPKLDSNNQLADTGILDHEKQLGRIAKEITFGSQKFKGFVNTDLTISGAIYALMTSTSNSVILAFSKESLANCPKTLEMLAEYGFTNFEDKVLQGGVAAKESTKDSNSTITVQLSDNPIPELQTTLLLLFKKEYPKKDLPTEHQIIPTVQDFPSYEALMTGDVAKIKEFEEKLGFRTYDPELSSEEKVNLDFETIGGKMKETNFSWVYYVSTPGSGTTKFINSQVNFIKNTNDFKDPKLKEWFTANGYGKDFYVASTFAFGYDDTGKIICQVFIDEMEGVALLQIYNHEETKSASQIRRLASIQYNRLMNSTHPMPSLKQRY